MKNFRSIALVALATIVASLNATAATLPNCVGEYSAATWNNCLGTETIDAPPGFGRYEGEWKNGKRHGQGIFYFLKDGLIFMGEFQNGNIDGQGTLTNAKGETKPVDLKLEIYGGKSSLKTTNTTSPAPTTPPPVANAIQTLNGNWYSPQWKYGYVLQNGVGTATSTNSPNFNVGQNIIQLTATAHNKFSGQQVYTDGKFYNVTATLQPDGNLYFEGEKNVKWTMTRVGAATNIKPTTHDSSLKNSSHPMEVGMCMGMVSHAIANNLIRKDRLQKNTANITNKYQPAFARLSSVVDKCTRGSSSGEVFKVCISKLDDRNDREFMNGFASGYGAALAGYSGYGTSEGLSIAVLEQTCIGIN